MTVDGSASILRVGEFGDPEHHVVVRLRDEVHLIAGLIGQVPNHVPVLCRKVLMDE
jgi:hypothetical protein